MKTGSVKGNIQIAIFTVEAFPGVKSSKTSVTFPLTGFTTSNVESCLARTRPARGALRRVYAGVRRPLVEDGQRATLITHRQDSSISLSMNKNFDS